MCKYKIAIYVEGQTEQILINHLILTWWSYSDIRVDNIKLVTDLKNPVQDFKPIGEYLTHFVIINVEGEGSLGSAILQRANRQIANSFQIIGLRDLDFGNSKISLNPVDTITGKLKDFLRKNGCNHSEKIGIYFAIMAIEAWILAFTETVSKWAKIPELKVNDIIRDNYPNLSLEKIRSPIGLLELIGNKKRDLKSYHEIKSLVSNINHEALHQVYKSNIVPSFSKFWCNLISTSHSA